MTVGEGALSLKRNALYNSIGSLTYLLCQWLVNVLVVRLGSYADGGMLTLAISVTNVFFVVATFSLRVYQASDVTGRFSASRYLSTRVMTSLLGLSLCVLFTLANVQYDAPQKWCIVLYMLFKLTEAWVDALAAEQQKAMRMDYILVSFLLRSVTSLGSLVAGMLLWHSLPLALLLMAAATLPVVLLYDLPIVRRMTGFRLRLRLSECLPLLRAAWPMMLNAAMMTLLISLPRYILEYHFGQEVMGIYGAVATPAVIVQAGCSFVYSPLVAPLSRCWSEGRRGDFRRMTARALGLVLALFLLVMAGAAVLGRWGLQLIFGESILPYAWLLPPVLMTSLCSALMYFFEVPLTIMGRLKSMTCVHLAASALSLALSMTLIPRLGMNGVNLTILLTAGLDAVAMGYMAFLLSRKEPPCRSK